MSDHDAFLRTCLAEPGDAGPRLVYADWLEEQGDCRRAEFLRLDSEWVALPGTDPRRHEIARRLVSLFYQHGRAWDRPRLDVSAQAAIDSLPAIVRLAPICDVRLDLQAVEVPLSVYEAVPESVARENIVMPLAWQEQIPRLVDAYPVRCRCAQGRYRGPSPEKKHLLLAAGQLVNDSDLIEKLEFIHNCNVSCLRSEHEEIAAAIDRHYGSSETGSVDCILFEFPVMDPDEP